MVVFPGLPTRVTSTYVGLLVLRQQRSTYFPRNIHSIEAIHSTAGTSYRLRFSRLKVSFTTLSPNQLLSFQSFHSNEMNCETSVLINIPSILVPNY